jgi:hypothetical protein
MLVARRRLLRQAIATIDVVTLIVSLIIAYVIVGVTFHREFATFRPYAWYSSQSLSSGFCASVHSAFTARLLIIPDTPQ